MKKTLKTVLCVLLCVAFCAGFCSCSSKAEMTEENVSQTVENTVVALQQFDTKNLEKYVDSATLDYIIKFAEKKDQFAQLGRAIFANLTMEIKYIDLENGTVTLDVKNRDLFVTATIFASELNSNYSKLQLVELLNDDTFLDTNLNTLVNDIDSVRATKNTTITLKIVQEKHNLKLAFDEISEDAVSGGALGAIKSIYS